MTLTTSISTRLATAALVVVGAVTVVGCGNASAPVNSTPSAPTSSASSSGPASSAPQQPASSGPGQSSQPNPTASSTGGGATHTITVGGVSVILPEGMTLPEGAKVDLSMPGRIVFTGLTREAVAAHFRAVLPQAGYTIDGDIDGGVITWNGQGWEGTVVISGSSTVISYWEPGQEPDDEASSTADDEVPVDPSELGVTQGVPFNFDLPQGSTISNITNAETGSSFIVTAPAPEKVHRHLVENVLHTVFFTIDSDEVTGGVGTLTFHSDDFNAVLTFEKNQVKVVFTQR